MTTIGEVTAYLDRVFRPELQEDYDNAGFLLGDSHAEYRGALVALDLTEAVADEAIELGLNMIVTHHPFIFGGVKRLTDGRETGRIVLSLARNDIAVYAAHTNLDNLPWGVSGALAEKLGLQNCRILRGVQGSAVECEGVQDNSSVGAGMVGELAEPMEAEAFLQRVKQLLGIPFIRVSQLNTEHCTLNTVRRVALCGGSGADFIPDAIAAGADLYLTADLK